MTNCPFKLMQYVPEGILCLDQDKADKIVDLHYDMVDKTVLLL